jgi:hypothetical protein
VAAPHGTEFLSPVDLFFMAHFADLCDNERARCAKWQFVAMHVRRAARRDLE